MLAVTIACDLFGSQPSYYLGSGLTQSASRGSITITSVDSTRRMDGSVNVEFPSRIVAQQFSAPWLKTGVLCG